MKRRKREPVPPPVPASGVHAHVACSVPMESIQALQPDQVEAFMAGIGKVMKAVE